MLNPISILRDFGFSPPPESFYELISLWDAWYRGRVRGFHD